VLKGALVQTPPGRTPSVILFQYNPETLTRRLDARATSGGDVGERSEPFRITGPPRETITLSVTLDATDALETGDPLAVSTGVAPALSALELLLYPPSATVIANASLASAGNIEIVPPTAPLTLLVWGPQRVLPVRVTGFTVTEQAYDVKLNPVLAKVDLTLAILSYADLRISDPGYQIFLAYQVIKERLVAQAPMGGAQATGAAIPRSA
jgi:hypothetical protein